MGRRGEPVVGWHTRKVHSGHYFNLSYLNQSKYSHGLLRGFAADWPILAAEIKSNLVLVIGGIAPGGTHTRAFKKAGIQGACVLADDKQQLRHLSILPLSELEKLTSCWELCFLDWPETARPEDVDLLGEWNQYRVFDESFIDLEQDLETPLSFLRRIGSSLLYFWYDGLDRHLLEPEPRVALDLFRADLQACAKLSNPGLAIDLSDRQLLSLMNPDGSYMTTSPRFIQVEADRIRTTVWRNGPNDRSMYRNYVFRGGEAEAAEDWESAGTPVEFIRRGWFGSPSCLVVLLILAILLWLVCRYVF